MRQNVIWAMFAVAVIGFGGTIEAAQPRSVEEAVGWLQTKSREMIPTSRRTMKNGVAAFPPQAGGGYEAFWLRDYEYMLEGCPRPSAIKN